MYKCRTCERAAAKVSGETASSHISGEVRFFQQKDVVLIEAVISGLPREDSVGFFGLHIHEGNSCFGSGFSETGTHYNPQSEMHPNHDGDLPPLLSTRDGKAYLTVKTDRFYVSDVIGRTVVIHSSSDDFRSQPSGNAGSKIACGVIRRV